MVTTTPPILGPDGLPVRSVGPWVWDKVLYVDRFADIFGKAMRNKWPRRAYLELFAGPGMSRVRGDDECIDGSAVRALGRDFTDYVYVDIDAASVAALRERVRTRARAEARATVLPPVDCNDAVDAIRDLIPRDALTLAFVDPTNWQVRLDTIERLVAGRRVDLLMTFHSGAMRRMRWTDDPTLDAFFGTPGWRGMLDLAPMDKVDALIDLYNVQLQVFGYLPGARLNRVAIVNSKGIAMYQLLLFSRNPLGEKFWKAAIDVKPVQGSLWAGW